MNSKIHSTLQQILEAFSSGKIPEAIALSLFPLADTPSRKWSLLNRTIIALAGTADARGFQQWKKVGRRVKKGGKAIYIFAPKMIKEKEESDHMILTGYLMIPVFRFEDTEGEPLAYEKVELPELPLSDVARAWGIELKAIPGNYHHYGYYNPDRKVIALATEDESVFFHELAHAAHEKVVADLKGGEDPWQEIVAELSAQALCIIVGKTSKHLGNSYRYIKNYAQKLDITPESACVKALEEVEAVLSLILNPSESQPTHPDVSGVEACVAREVIPRGSGKPYLTTSDLQFLLVGNRIKLDCGHMATPGHNLANTIIIYSEGGGKIKTMCHECYD